jgi:hypothetical protein
MGEGEMNTDLHIPLYKIELFLPLSLLYLEIWERGLGGEGINVLVI